jgi:hypothetical protein
MDICSHERSAQKSKKDRWNRKRISKEFIPKNLLITARFGKTLGFALDLSELSSVRQNRAFNRMARLKLSKLLP